MTEMTELGLTRGRMLKSARLLKAYFERKLNLSLELLTAPPSEPVVDGMQFDLAISGLGLWGLRASGPLSEKTQSEIAATFHGLLGAMDNLETRRLDLLLMQEKYEATIRELPNNVIPLRRATLARRPAFSSVSDKRWILRLDCLIESAATVEIQKMAFELHSQSKRYAFLQYSDIDRATRLNLSELLQLGAVTIFVPSMLELSMQEQEVLRHLVQVDSSERPLLMVGANVPYADLRCEPAIHLELLALLSRAYIKLTRPFSEYKEKGLIHYFLDSLSQNPS